MSNFYKSPVSKLFDSLNKDKEDKYSNPYVEQYRNEDTSVDDVSSFYTSSKQSMNGYENFNMGTYKQMGFGQSNDLYAPRTKDMYGDSDNPYDAPLNKIDTYSKKLNELGIDVPELDKVEYSFMEGLGDLFNIVSSPLNSSLRVKDKMEENDRRVDKVLEDVIASDDFKNYAQRKNSLGIAENNALDIATKKKELFKDEKNKSENKTGLAKWIDNIGNGLTGVGESFGINSDAQVLREEAKKYLKETKQTDKLKQLEEADTFGLVEGASTFGKTFLSSLTGLAGKNIAKATDNKELMDWYRNNEGGVVTTLKEMRQGTYGENTKNVPSTIDDVFGNTLGQIASIGKEGEEKEKVKQAVGQFATDFLAGAVIEGKFEVDDAGKALSYMKNVRSGKVDDINKAVDQWKALEVVKKVKKSEIDDLANKSSIDKARSYLKNTDELDKLRTLGDDGVKIVDDAVENLKKSEASKITSEMKEAMKTDADYLLRKTKDFLGDYDFEGVKYFGRTVLDKQTLSKIAKNDKLYRATQIGLTVANPLALPYSVFKGSTKSAIERLSKGEYSEDVLGSFKKTKDELLSATFDKFGGGKNASLKRQGLEDYNKALDSIGFADEMKRRGYKVTDELTKDIDNVVDSVNKLAKNYGKSVDEVNKDMINIAKVIEDPVEIKEMKVTKEMDNPIYLAELFDAKRNYLNDLRGQIKKQIKVNQSMYKNKSNAQKLKMALQFKDKFALNRHLEEQLALLDEYSKVNVKNFNIDKSLDDAFKGTKVYGKFGGENLIKKIKKDAKLMSISKTRKMSIGQLSKHLVEKYKIDWKEAQSVANKFKAVMDGVYKNLEEAGLPVEGATISRKNFNVDELMDKHGVENVENGSKAFGTKEAKVEDGIQQIKNLDKTSKHYSYKQTYETIERKIASSERYIVNQQKQLAKQKELGNKVAEIRIQQSIYKEKDKLKELHNTLNKTEYSYLRATGQVDTATKNTIGKTEYEYKAPRKNSVEEKIKKDKIDVANFNEKQFKKSNEDLNRKNALGSNLQDYNANMKKQQEYVDKFEAEQGKVVETDTIYSQRNEKIKSLKKNIFDLKKKEVAFRKQRKMLRELKDAKDITDDYRKQLEKEYFDYDPVEHEKELKTLIDNVISEVFGTKKSTYRGDFDRQIKNAEKVLKDLNDDLYKSSKANSKNILNKIKEQEELIRNLKAQADELNKESWHEDLMDIIEDDEVLNSVSELLANEDNFFFGAKYFKQKYAKENLNRILSKEPKSAGAKKMKDRILKHISDTYGVDAKTIMDDGKKHFFKNDKKIDINEDELIALRDNLYVDKNDLQVLTRNEEGLLQIKDKNGKLVDFDEIDFNKYQQQIIDLRKQREIILKAKDNLNKLVKNDFPTKAQSDNIAKYNESLQQINELGKELVEKRNASLNSDWRVIKTKGKKVATMSEFDAEQALLNILDGELVKVQKTKPNDVYKFATNIIEKRTSFLTDKQIQGSLYDAKAILSNNVSREVIEKRSMFDYLDAYMVGKNSKKFTDVQTQIDAKKILDNPRPRDIKLDPNEAKDFHTRFTGRAYYTLMQFKKEVVQNYNLNAQGRQILENNIDAYMKTLNKSGSQEGIEKLFATPNHFDVRGQQLQARIEKIKDMLLPFSKTFDAENVQGNVLRKMVADKKIIRMNTPYGTISVDEKLTKKQLEEVYGKLNKDLLGYSDLVLTKDIGSEGKRIKHHVLIESRGGKVQASLPHEIAHILDNRWNKKVINNIVSNFVKVTMGADEKTTQRIINLFDKYSVSGSGGSSTAFLTKYLKQLSDELPTTKEAQIVFDREYFAEITSIALSSNKKAREEMFDIFGQDFKNDFYSLLAKNRKITSKLIPSAKMQDEMYKENIKLIQNVLEANKKSISTFEDVDRVDAELGAKLDHNVKHYLEVEEFLTKTGHFNMPEGMQRTKLIETDMRCAELINKADNLDEASKQVYDSVVNLLRNIGISDGTYNRVKAVLDENYTYLTHILNDKLKDNSTAKKVYSMYFGDNQPTLNKDVRNVYAKGRKYQGTIEQINKQLSMHDELLANDITELLETNLEKIVLKRAIDSNRILNDMHTKQMMLDVFGEKMYKYQEVKEMFTSTHARMNEYGKTVQETSYEIESFRDFLIKEFDIDHNELDSVDTIQVQDALRNHSNVNKIRNREGLKDLEWNMDGKIKRGDRFAHMYKVYQKKMYERLQSGDYELVKLNARTETTKMKAFDLTEYENMLNNPNRSGRYDKEIFDKRIKVHNEQIFQTKQQMSDIDLRMKENINEINKLKGKSGRIPDADMRKWGQLKEENSMLETQLKEMNDELMKLEEMKPQELKNLINGVINDNDAVGRLNVIDHKKLQEVDVIKELDDGAVIVPKRVNEWYSKNAQMQVKKNTDAFVKIYKKMTQLFKASALFTPQFHWGNAMQNMISTYSEVGTRAISPKYISQATRTNLVNSSIGIAKGWGKERIKNGMTLKQVKDIFDELGGVQMNRMSEYVDRFALLEGRVNATTLQKISPFSTKFKGYEWSQRFGDQLESNSRLMNFIYHLENGKSPQEAMDLTNNILFDYNDLTEFESGVMKELMPFYTFLRKNVASQAERLVNKPTEAKLVSLMYEVGNAHTSEEDKRIAPEFLTNTSIPLGNGQYFKLNTGVSSLGDVLDPKSLLSGVNPIFKAPTEAVLNRNFFNDAEVSKYDKTDEKLWHVATSINPILKQLSNVKDATVGTDYDKQLARQKLSEQWLLERAVTFDRQDATKRMLDDYADELNSKYFEEITGKNKSEYEQKLLEIEAMKKLQKKKKNKSGLFD